MTRDQLIEMQKQAWPSDYQQLVDRHGYDPKGMTKFYNHDFQWSESAIRVQTLGIKAAPPAMRCLDIGPAAGHFPFLLKLLGHDVHTIEVPNNPPYTDSLEMLRIPTTQEFVLANKPLAREEGTQNLDLITSTGICFDIIPDQMTRWVHNTQGYLWGVEEWCFLIDDMLSRLRSGGRIHLKNNFNWPGGAKGNKVVWIQEQPAFHQYLREHASVERFQIQMPVCDIWKK